MNEQEKALEFARAMQLPDLVRVEDLSRHLGMTEREIVDMLEHGELPGRQLRGVWLMSRLALLERFS